MRFRVFTRDAEWCDLLMGLRPVVNLTGPEQPIERKCAPIVDKIDVVITTVTIDGRPIEGLDIELAEKPKPHRSSIPFSVRLKSGKSTTVPGGDYRLMVVTPVLSRMFPTSEVSLGAGAPASHSITARSELREVLIEPEGDVQPVPDQFVLTILRDQSVIGSINHSLPTRTWLPYPVTVMAMRVRDGKVFDGHLSPATGTADPVRLRLTAR
jgi:hypothetical protein